MIKLGAKVEDITTGIRGILSARCEYLEGRTEYAIRIKEADADRTITEWVPEQYLKVIDNGVHIEPIKKIMGFGNV